MTDYNTPVYKTEDITLGQCIVYIDPYRTPSAAGVTPSTGVGAIDECTVSVQREYLDFIQGTPQNLIEQYCIGEKGQLKIKGWEWNFNNFYKVMASGSTSASGSEEYYDFGGEISVQKVQIRLEHRTPAGATIYLDFWKASGSGKLDFPFNPKDFNKFDYEYNLWRGTANWINTTLAAGEYLFKYTKVNEPSHT